MSPFFFAEEQFHLLSPKDMDRKLEKHLKQTMLTIIAKEINDKNH